MQRGSSADGAEIAQLRRLAAVCPPLMLIWRMGGSDPPKMRRQMQYIFYHSPKGGFAQAQKKHRESREISLRVIIDTL